MVREQNVSEYKCEVSNASQDNITINITFTTITTTNNSNNNSNIITTTTTNTTTYNNNNNSIGLT
ncbi:hypothetical protein E2C01_036796 [Portunus trituberculatus]|uniref:Uncharacterized protein n=1 Tax=Portunus trituberculatus TaxID=210409 RepID=A0A5B7FDM4_PORTR|nr:hypothetical protein [Portunus trituberculatus]